MTFRYLTFVFLIIALNVDSQGLVIDHTYENLPDIPASWIDSVKVKQKWHYAHASHGRQLITGLDTIETIDPFYNVEAKGSLPIVPDAFCILNKEWEFPEEYWKSATGMNKTRSILNNNPAINVSQWSWCAQLNQYSESETQDYLDSISQLEIEFPNVTFVYMTGNAQSGPGNHYSQSLTKGYNRYLRNQQIRAYCIANNKVLFDFADMDCWWYNPETQEWEYSTYEYWNGSDTVTVPFEHPHYNFDEADHTSYENCINKGKAAWGLMAELAGWHNGKSLEIMVFLEGSFNGSGMNLFPEPILPLYQPYNIEPWNYQGTETVTSIPENVVDWVLVELRDATSAGSATSSSVIKKQAAFLLNDGSVVDLDGYLALSFNNSIVNSLFVVVWHRNHLGIMSASPLTESNSIYTYNFTIAEGKAFGANSQKNLEENVFGMFAADANGDGMINIEDKLEWQNQVGTKGYKSADFSLEGQVKNNAKNEKWLPNFGKESYVPE